MLMLKAEEEEEDTLRDIPQQGLTSTKPYQNLTIVKP
jgi:hypothetical protein